MARFDIYELDGPVPLAMDVQADLHSDLGTRVIVPLLSYAKNKQEAMPRLHPVLSIKGKNYILMTTNIATVRAARLGAKIGNAEGQRQVVVDALDFLMQGF